MRRLIIVTFCIGLAACARPVTIANPCGVIIDSLKDVRGATPAETRRIDKHHGRGFEAGCWQ